MTFYDNELDEVLSNLSTSEDGLTSAEAKSRLLRNGKNKLREGHKKSKFAKFMDQFKDLMIIILIIAAIFSGISSYANHEPYTDTIIIILVVFLNAMMGFVQELKAESAVESLRKMTATVARVKRDGKTQVVNTEDIVIGDILELEAGDRVPADARVIWEVQSSVDESMLTGESEMVQKDVERIGSNVPLNERTNMVYSGCNVVYGKMIAVVTATGMDTELGKIASTIQKDKDVLSPLQIKINNVSKVLSAIIGIIIAAILVYSIYVGNDLLESIMLCISLAVAAIPEGLPAVITIALSLGTTSMAKKNTIVRKISSVETDKITYEKVSTAFDDYLNMLENKQDENSICTRGYIQNHLYPYFGKYKFKDITQETLINYQSKMLSEGYSVASIKRFISTFQKIMKKYSNASHLLFSTQETILPSLENRVLTDSEIHQRIKDDVPKGI